MANDGAASQKESPEAKRRKPEADLENIPQARPAIELIEGDKQWQNTSFTEKSRGKRSSAASIFWPTP
jgi:hypothetical protein